jgi:hypothetical protein
MAHRAANQPPLLTPERRRWLYRVILAGLLVAAGYGLVTDQQVTLWVGLVTAFLGLGVAERNVPKGTP